ncbi:MAG: hypothetical protein ACOY71_10795 [Gemmatimonadota bacterium]
MTRDIARFAALGLLFSALAQPTPAVAQRTLPLKPLKAGEFYSSGFLTEERALPFGLVLGNVEPSQIRARWQRPLPLLHGTIAIEPPKGATYQPGDSLLVVRLGEFIPGYGHVVQPTGIVRVTGTRGPAAIATIVALFGQVVRDQKVLPLEKFSSPGVNIAPVAVQNGVTGRILGSDHRRELFNELSVLFIDVGSKDGVARGDLFEVRRRAANPPGEIPSVSERMAVGQVVHVRERTATLRLLKVLSPDIPVGTPVIQIAKLPS